MGVAQGPFEPDLIRPACTCRVSKCCEFIFKENDDVSNDMTGFYGARPKGLRKTLKLCQHLAMHSHHHHH
ncbi:hypothetical protein SDC9_42663 [bioreactor metagenome]|uniref:Uncharacterized protein n=1 Tax=bioreactor metagenome TaxID=1076179 RepID=A0A644W192_9ZZZZ